MWRFQNVHFHFFVAHFSFSFFSILSPLPIFTAFTLELKCGSIKRGVLVPHTFTSSEHFANFASANQIYVASQRGVKKRAVMSLSDAQQLADGEFLMLSTPFDALDERIGQLDGHVKNSSGGHEHATTQAIARCAMMREQFGQLRVVNNGFPVTFNGKNGPVLEADGLVINSVVLLLNEVKHMPSIADARLQKGRARILLDILSDPSAYSSEPDHILPELVDTKLKSVQPVLSGYNFAPSVEAACMEEGVLVMKTNGSDYSNAARATLASVTSQGS